MCRRLLKDVGYENQAPPLLIGTHDPSVFFFLLFVYCPMSSIRIVLAVEVGLRDGLDWISVLIMNPS